MPLSFTSMMRPEMMLSAATRTIMVSIMNITLRSTCQRGEESLVALSPVRQQDRRPAASSMASSTHPMSSGLSTIISSDCTFFRTEILLRLGQRHIDNALVIFRHADLEDGHHRII